MKQVYYSQKYEDYTLQRSLYIYIEETMIELKYKEAIRVIDGELHPLIKSINLN